jgi:ABC-type transport system involved in cytochrome bd biosynthesis fused ATPase/permease subunit
MTIRGNFLGAAIVAIIYTVYIVTHPFVQTWETALVLVILNALTIMLMYFAFRDVR